jgi:UDP-N-acetylglucosamine 2-epimerase (non-hydrolysing)/GDP/UDP-N,N'-diacetylbacillosamine 2-epimerase (hydrolysing)
MPRKKSRSSRRICFVTGSRAEFGLMQSVLDAIAVHKALKLQIVVTGMHLDRRHGNSINQIRRDWRVNAVVNWKGANRAVATGNAIASLATVFKRLKPDVVLIVGDRVEAFAAATASHLSDIAVAHVHGGDRALGQMDDSLRHAISKLAHIHFPATTSSAERLAKIGEDRWRIHRVGSPGIDGIVQTASATTGFRPFQFALLVLHPIVSDDAKEFRHASEVIRALQNSKIPQTVVIYPNNDPGFAGIIRRWNALKNDPRFILHPDVNRPHFLALLRDAALLIGNSSSGIIEAASFRTPVIDVGPRQLGRERCDDVVNAPYRASAIRRAISRLWNNGRPIRGRCATPYAAERTGQKIAQILSQTTINSRLLRKIISF